MVERPRPDDDEDRPLPVDGGLLYLELNLIFSPSREGWEMIEPKTCTSCADVTITNLCMKCGQREGEFWVLECGICGKGFRSIRRNSTTCSAKCRAANHKRMERECRERQNQGRIFLPGGHWRKRIIPGL